MNNSKKLALSKETLRSLDDEDLTNVVGGSRREHGGGGHNNNNSFGCSGHLRQLRVQQRYLLRPALHRLAGTATA